MAAAPPRFGALVVLRIIQAFGACSVISMGAGTIADITPPAKRAFAMSIFSLGPQLGPVTGGVIGGALAGNVSWRWIFGLLETLRYLVGNGTVYKGKPWILFPPPFFTRAPKDPIPGQGPKPPKPSFKTYWNLFSYPPIGIVSFNSALLFASFYCIATSLPVTLERDYHWSTSDVGLAYLAPGVAMAGSSLVTGQISDWHRKKLIEGKKKQAAQASAKQQIANGTNGVTTTNNDLEKTGAEDKPGTGPTTQQTQPKLNPESRLLTQYPGVIISALGTFLYGWLLDRHLHPAPVLVGASLAAGGMSSVFVTSQAFCTEVVPTQAAATVALANMLRNPAAAVAAAIVQPLIDRMGIGWCFTGLGILNIVGVGAGLGLIWWRGEFWRSERERKLTEQKETQEMKTKAPG
ncbi:MAG: Dityrosine transporter 1 [Alyxoria varia]|nr:MAG: Dityrosine transporter 1 [Alyxoria varia]